MSIAKLCGSLQSDEADLRCRLLVAKSQKRPIFHPDLGEMLAKLRTAHGWSVQEAVNYSRPKHKAALTWNRLTRLESGKTKHPDREALRALADIYGISYTELARSYVSANYGRDLLRHGGEGTSNLPPREGESDVPATTRIRELEARVEELQTYKTIVEHVRPMLADALVALGDESDRTATKKTARGRRH